MITTDSRIGKLSTGKYYAYVNGYSSEPVTGTLAKVEKALGVVSTTKVTYKEYVATVVFSDGSQALNEITCKTRNQAIRILKNWATDEYTAFDLNGAKYRAKRSA